MRQPLRTVVPQELRVAKDSKPPRQSPPLSSMNRRRQLPGPSLQSDKAAEIGRDYPRVELVVLRTNMDSTLIPVISQIFP
jgi:hypothetical protein